LYNVLANHLGLLFYNRFIVKAGSADGKPLKATETRRGSIPLVPGAQTEFTVRNQHYVPAFFPLRN